MEALLHAYPRIRPTIAVSKPPAATPHPWKGLPMNNATSFVGPDVHARSIKACAFAPETGEVERKSLGHDPGELASWMKSLPQPTKCIYESGVTGFHLCRELRFMGVDCAIGALKKITVEAAGRSRKTDRRDAHILAALNTSCSQRLSALTKSELPAAFGHKPARQDDAVGGLAPELVGVLSGWVGHVRCSFVVVGMHPKGMAPLACVSERTIQVTNPSYLNSSS